MATTAVAAGCAHAGRCTAAARSALGVRAAAPPAVRGGGRRLGFWNNPHSGAAGGVRLYMWRGCAFGAPPNFTWGGARHCGSVECSSGGHTRPLRAAISLAATAGKFGWVEGMPTPDRVPWKCNSGSAACTSRVLPGPQNAIPRRISAWGGHLRISARPVCLTTAKKRLIGIPNNRQ